MDRQTNGQIGKWTDRQKDRQKKDIYGKTDEWINTQMDRWTNRQKDRQTKRHTDTWKDR